MNIGRREETDSTMVMFVVVPTEECSRPSPGIGLATKTFGIIRAIFQGLELRFREGIIVGNMWTGVGLRDAQIRHKQGDWFG